MAIGKKQERKKKENILIHLIHNITLPHLIVVLLFDVVITVGVSVVHIACEAKKKRVTCDSSRQVNSLLHHR